MVNRMDVSHFGKHSVSEPHLHPGMCERLSTCFFDLLYDVLRHICVQPCLYLQSRDRRRVVEANWPAQWRKNVATVRSRKGQPA